QMYQKGEVEKLIRSISRFSEKVLLILSNQSHPHVSAKKIGPALIFQRLWTELGIDTVLCRLLEGRKFEFDVERAIFLTVLHRLFASGSDRACDRWKRDYLIQGAEELSLHHHYRAMSFLGETIEDQVGRTPFIERRIKDQVEEGLFDERRDLFTGLDFVFFDTTSIYFEGEGGEVLGQLGRSKDHRPENNQMVVGAVLDNSGKPICCEMWPGNTTDVKSLIPVTDRIRKRFGVGDCCLIADRGMISNQTLDDLQERHMPFILGARMRKVREIKLDVFSRGGRYKEVHPEGKKSKDPSPLQVKEVKLEDKRYIVCLNTRQARKDAADREAIIASLEEKLQKQPKSLIANKGYRKYLKLDRGHLRIDKRKIEEDARFDGKWVLLTNTDLPAEDAALKYKELWQVEQVFRDIKTVLETRPIFHQKDETITGHVFCSFLALVLLKELERRIGLKGSDFEWADIKQDLQALQEITITEDGRRLAIRSDAVGTCGKVFQAVGVALPPTIREL
ncbi:IS1634 family transposase, partial [bacterium]|nr:IS1634 family transposase [candidate division CSSED10-310 bacterium]